MKKDKKEKPLSKTKQKKLEKAAEKKRKEKEFDDMAFWMNVFDDDDF